MDCLKADLVCQNQHKHHIKAKGCACEKSQHQTQRKMPALLRLDSVGEEGGVLSVPMYCVGSKPQDSSSKRKNYYRASKSADSISPDSSVTLSFSSSPLKQTAKHALLQKCNSLTEVSSGSNSFSSSKSSAKPNLKSCSMLSLLSTDFSCKKNSVAKMNDMCSESNSFHSSTKCLGSILCSAMTMYPAVAMTPYSKWSPHNISEDNVSNQKFQNNCSPSCDMKEKDKDQEKVSLVLSQDQDIQSAKASTCGAMPSLYSKPRSKDVHVPVQVESNAKSMQPITSVDVNKECSVSGSDETSSSCDSIVNEGKNTSTKLNGEKDLSSVLLCQRKKHKKGRPSAKKQKKRQRSKSKHSSTPMPLASSSPLATKNESHKSCDKSDDSLDASAVFSVESEITKDKVSESSSSSICFEEPFSAKAKVTCKNPIIARVLCASSSDESDCEDDSNDDGDEWGDSFNGSLAIASNHALGFDIALSVDSLFKPKAVHSLRSILFSESEEEESETESSSNSKNSMHFTLSVSVPECDSDSSCVDSFSQASVLPDDSLPLDSKHAFAFPQGSLIDKISGNSTAHQRAEKAADDDTEESAPDSIIQINAKWDRVYPTAGFRSCTSEATVINSPTVRVKFACVSQLETIHVVGAEDRKGTWHLYAVDRERFQRRIQEISAIISPILSDSHRANIKHYINEQ